jgi:hypothetical protein
VNRVLWTAAALSAAVVVLGVVSLPPARRVLTAEDDGTVAGAIHIHTNRSDGRSPPDVVAAAAARAGLKFIVLTDHGDGTRMPDPPAYRSGVLCLDGVEVSTSEGHLLAMGLPRTPYALGGEARGVVEDVTRLGGISVAAHPDSPKEELRWRAWSEPVDGVELVNLDTSWRLHAFGGGSMPRLSLLTDILSYPFRPAETIAKVVRPTRDVLGSWSARATTRRTVILAGSDAHARLALTDVDPGENRWTLPLPGYEASFRALSVHVTPARPLTGDAAADSHSLLQGLRAGHAYVAVDGLAAPAFFEFTASNQSGHARQGDELRDGGEVTLRVRSNAPEGFRTFVFRDAVRMETSGAASDLKLKAPSGPAVYRVEFRASEGVVARVWVMTNPI